MANVYTIDFTVTLSTCRDFLADSEREALDMATRLLECHDFRYELTMDWDDQPHEPNDPKVLAMSNMVFDKEELRELYGLE